MRGSDLRRSRAKNFLIVVSLLREWPRTEGSEFVVNNCAGGRIGWLQHRFRKALGRACLSDLHSHDLRHTFASQWMMAGGDLYVLKSILGHKSTAMTRVTLTSLPATRRRWSTGWSRSG